MVALRSSSAVGSEASGQSGAHCLCDGPLGETEEDQIMKLFDGNRYQLRPKEGGTTVAQGLSALDDGIDIILTEPPHLDPVPPGGTYPRYPEYEAFHWL